jgi:formylmethanofuran dehydrogenase subunit E
MPVVPALGRLRQENEEFKASLGYIVREEGGRRERERRKRKRNEEEEDGGGERGRRKKREEEKGKKKEKEEGEGAEEELFRLYSLDLECPPKAPVSSKQQCSEVGLLGSDWVRRALNSI